MPLDTSTEGLANIDKEENCQLPGCKFWTFKYGLGIDKLLFYVPYMKLSARAVVILENQDCTVLKDESPLLVVAKTIHYKM